MIDSSIESFCSTLETLKQDGSGVLPTVSFFDHDVSKEISSCHPEGAPSTGNARNSKTLCYLFKRWDPATDTSLQGSRSPPGHDFWGLVNQHPQGAQRLLVGKSAHRGKPPQETGSADHSSKQGQCRGIEQRLCELLVTTGWATNRESSQGRRGEQQIAPSCLGGTEWNRGH